MILGTVREIWRYPVKSMAGGLLESALLGPQGIPGDRGFALRDETAGEIRGAKKMPALLRCEARYLEEPTDTRVPPAEIRLPGGTTLRSDDPSVSERLSSLLGRRVTLWPRQPAGDLDHYRRALPDHPDFETELREIFGRLADEPLPDISVFPAEILQYTSPLGTYFDAFPLLVLTTAWLDELGRRNPKSSFDRRRFRPNLLIEPAGGKTGFVELDWSGKTIRVGSAEIKIEMPCVRCSMTIRAQQDLAEDPAVLRTIVRESDQNVGAYASVVRPGEVKVGDPVEA